jgi:hypothetical protein
LPVSASVKESRTQLKKSQDYEREQWMSHFDEQGRWKRNFQPVSGDDLYQIRTLKSKKENLEVIQRVSKEIPLKIQGYDQYLKNFRDKKSAVSTLNHTDFYSLSLERSELFVESQQKANEIYKKSYEEMVKLGQKLKKVIESSRGGGN